VRRKFSESVRWERVGNDPIIFMLCGLSSLEKEKVASISKLCKDFLQFVKLLLLNKIQLATRWELHDYPGSVDNSE